MKVFATTFNLAILFSGVAFSANAHLGLSATSGNRGGKCSPRYVMENHGDSYRNRHVDAGQTTSRRRGVTGCHATSSWLMLPHTERHWSIRETRFDENQIRTASAA